MTILPELLSFILSFLIGSISSAVIICRLMNLPDPRTKGSNNPGTTNVLRIGGKKAATITLIFDALKGFLPVFLTYLFGFDLLTMTLVGLSAFLGHIYPIWFGFKGGKGVATFLGVLFALNTLLGLTCVLTWLLMAKVIRVSSLSALVTSALSPVYFYLLTENFAGTIVIVIMSVWIFWTHKTNIQRLLKKEENKLH